MEPQVREHVAEARDQQAAQAREQEGERRQLFAAKVTAEIDAERNLAAAEAEQARGARDVERLRDELREAEAQQQRRVEVSRMAQLAVNTARQCREEAQAAISPAAHTLRNSRQAVDKRLATHSQKGWEHNG